MRGRALAALLIAAAELAQAPIPQGDPRILHIPYALDQIVPVQVGLGYAVVVELSPDDPVENIVVGNSTAWQVTANKRGDHLVIKPLVADVSTNVVVTAGDRRYVFLLSPSAGGNAGPFVVRFDYPPPRSTAKAASTPITRYSLSGDRALRPTSITDDGWRTRITWPKEAPLPAVFAVDRDGQEALINGRMVDDSYVIERTASRFIFRRGRSVAMATRRVLAVKP